MGYKEIKGKIILFWFRTLPKYVCYCRNAGFARREWFCYRFLKKHLRWTNSVWDELELEAPCSSEVARNKTIFVYWKQGFGNAPLIVKKCLESVKRNAGDYSVLCLSEDNLNDYVMLPQHVIKKHEKGLIGEAHFSDIVRANLIYRYGGVWLDATCFLSRPIDDYVTESPFFMFQNTKLGCISPIKCSNWFIKGSAGSTLLKAVLNFIYSYYQNFDVVVHYYLFHLILSLIVDERKDLAKEWYEMPFVCNMNPHVFLFSLEKKYSANEYKQILQSCFVHKLTYKFPSSLLEEKEENMLQHFIRG